MCQRGVWVTEWVRLEEGKNLTKYKTKNLMTKKFSNTDQEKPILWESMDCSRINTAKKQKLKDQAARQKHYVQTLFELELHIICLNVPLQHSKMCYLLESYHRLPESALQLPAALCFCHWFFKKHNTLWKMRGKEFWCLECERKCSSQYVFEICKLFIASIAIQGSEI